MEAVHKWRQYLLGREFVIRSDQKSLKELLLQVIQTPDQQLYVRKLMVYKFRIEYKTGASNKVADALSRRDMLVGEEAQDLAPDEPTPGSSAATDSALLSAVSHPVPDIIDLLRQEARVTDELVRLRARMADGSAPVQFTESDGLIYWNRRLFVGKDSVAKPALLYEHHSTPSAGHPGVDRTFRRLAAGFYW